MGERYTFLDEYVIVEDSSLFGKEKFYKLCNETDNKYIKIPTEKVNYVKQVIELLDGKHTLDEIENEIFLKKGIRMDVKTLVQLFKQNGFIKEETLSTEKNEIDLLTKEVIGFTPKLKNQSIYLMCKKIKMLAAILYSMGFVIGIAIITFHARNLLHNSYDMYHFQKVGAVMIALYISLGLHELSHVVVALAFEKPIARISFNLYLGCLPMIYLRIRGINSLQVRKRIQVILAGITTNFFLAVIFLAMTSLQLGGEKGNELLWIIGISNLFAGLLNFIPFTLTDGYFALSILMNRYDMRNFLWKGGFLNCNSFQMKKSERRIYIIYASLSVLSLVYIVCSFVRWIVNVYKRCVVLYEKIGIILLLLFVIYCILQVVFNLFGLRRQRKRN